MKWDADGLEMFHAGSMLRARLPGFGWTWDWLHEGIMIQRINEHTLKKEDITFKPFSDLVTFAEFTAFCDEVTEIVASDILTKRFDKKDTQWHVGCD